MTNVFKKKVTATIMVILMAVSMVSIKSDAATVGSGLFESSGTYVVYVWEQGNKNLLGKMRMTKGDSWVQNAFEADKNCLTTTVSVSANNRDYETAAKNSVKKGTFLAVSLIYPNPTRIYGSCTVNY